MVESLRELNTELVDRHERGRIERSRLAFGSFLVAAIDQTVN
jgi:hypothetical protein